MEIIRLLREWYRMYHTSTRTMDSLLEWRPSLSLSWKTAAYAGASLISGYVLYEQFRFAPLLFCMLMAPRFYQWGHSLKGPSLAIPVIGAIVEMVKSPYDFWERQRLMNPEGLSWNSIVGQFMVFSTKTEITKKIFMNNGEDSFRLFLHPNGWKILGNSILCTCVLISPAVPHSMHHSMPRSLYIFL